MNDIQILEAASVNVNDYRKLRLEALYEEPQAFGSCYKDQVDLPIDEWQKWLNNYIEGKSSWMVFAAKDNELVGMIGAYSTDETKKNQSAQIIAMYVTKDARGKGISKVLMKSLLEKLVKETLIKEVVLDVNIDQTTAVNLYKSFGFTITKNDKLTLGDGKEHEVYLMTKAL